MDHFDKITWVNFIGIYNIDVGSLTRYEKGQREPTSEVLLTYHILFGASIIDIFHEQFTNLCKKLHSRSLSLIEQLKVERPPKSELRIKYVQNIITRLSENDNEADN